MLQKLLYGVITAAMLCTPAVASAQASSADNLKQKKIVKALDAKSIEPVLKTITGNHLLLVDANGNHYISATATNGLKFEIFFHGCDNAAAVEIEDMKCRGMNLISIWESGNAPEKVAASIPSFLRENPIVNAGSLEDGSFYVTRYVIADYGTAQGNLLSEMANFVRIASNFANTMNKVTAN
ncbi:hypothetical protein ACR9YC_10070 [Parasphingorhabdus sp. DH2-15]|uniref:hypothetical protein n=1 Tax=Parasphingorhabdus sp. DH2-15 TaxID=3444112 RepID=UPI003F688152